MSLSCAPRKREGFSVHLSSKGVAALTWVASNITACVSKQFLCFYSLLPLGSIFHTTARVSFSKANYKMSIWSVIRCQFEIEIKLPTSDWSSKSKKVPGKYLLLIYWLCQTFDCVDHKQLWKILQEMEIPDHLTCLLRNLYAGQEVTVRTGHGTRLVPNRKRSTSRLYIVTLLI